MTRLNQDNTAVTADIDNRTIDMHIRLLRWSLLVFAGALVAAGPAVAQPVSGVAGGVSGGARAGVGADVQGGVTGGLDMAQVLGALDKLKTLEQFRYDQKDVPWETLKELTGEARLKMEALGDQMKFLKDFKPDFKDFKPELKDLKLDFKYLDSPAGKMDLFGQPQDRADREREAEMRERERENRLYDEGQQYIEQSRYDRAAERFADVASMKGAKADAALYWKAWSQNRLGQRAEALASIAALGKDYSKSRYLAQAKALEVEVRQSSGQPVRPENEADLEMKILALNGLQNSAPDQAIPVLQKILDSPASPKLKERALYVLAQSNSAQSREILKNIAKGGSTPELQNRAIQYLGVHGGRESRAVLAEIYSTADADAKRRILRAFMSAGEKDRVYTAAQSEKEAEVRQEAVRLLGAMGAREELWQLYQKESSLDVKKQILSAMFAGGDVVRMIDLAKSEQNPELRRIAVRNLGNMGTRQTGDALVEIYNSEKDVNVRKTIIQGLGNQDNATALVALARKEQDITLKKEIVQRLSNMRSKIATDYLIELLNK